MKLFRARGFRIGVSLAAILSTFAITSCAGKESGSADQKKPAHLASEIDAATTGTISGRVSLDGKPPDFHPIDMSAEPSCQAAHDTMVIPPQVVTDLSGNLANAVVYVKSGPTSEYGFRAAGQAAELTQQGCMYEPHVLALMTGQRLLVKNEDQATHNVFVMAKANQPTNRSETPGSPAIEETFIAPELAIPVKCNVHPWMKGYVFVFDHPFFAVTQKGGTFELKGLPPGNYTIGVWQEYYGTTEQTVTLAPKQDAKMNFTFKSSSGNSD